MVKLSRFHMILTLRSWSSQQHEAILAALSRSDTTSVSGSSNLTAYHDSQDYPGMSSIEENDIHTFQSLSDSSVLPHLSMHAYTRATLRVCDGRLSYLLPTTNGRSFARRDWEWGFIGRVLSEEARRDVYRESGGSADAAVGEEISILLSRKRRCESSRWGDVVGGY